MEIVSWPVAIDHLLVHKPLMAIEMEPATTKSLAPPRPERPAVRVKGTMVKPVLRSRVSPLHLHDFES